MKCVYYPFVGHNQVVIFQVIDAPIPVKCMDLDCMNDSEPVHVMPSPQRAGPVVKGKK